MKNKIGKFYIVATPIGNMGDITLRAIETLQKVDLVLCEDTRVTRLLLKKHMISKELATYNDYAEEHMQPKIINWLNQGKDIALVSDAGTPIISDPGFKLIRELKKQNFQIFTIPGPCSVIAALTIAGLPTDRFIFIGFLPSKKVAKNKTLKDLVNLQASIVCFETANRLIETLSIINDLYQERELCLVKEISKIFEQAINGTAKEITSYFEDNPDKLRGEMVLIIARAECEAIDLDQLDDYLKLKLECMSLKDAVEKTAEQYSSMAKKIIYKRALEIKGKIV